MAKLQGLWYSWIGTVEMAVAQLRGFCKVGVAMKVVDGLHWFTALLYYNSNRLIFSFRLIGSTGRRKITVVIESAAVSAGSSTEKL